MDEGQLSQITWAAERVGGLKERRGNLRTRRRQIEEKLFWSFLPLTRGLARRLQRARDDETEVTENIQEIEERLRRLCESALKGD